MLFGDQMTMTGQAGVFMGILITFGSIVDCHRGGDV